MTDQSQSEKIYIPVYGDLTSLNTCRLIKETVGESTLREIAQNYLDLLETSGAIYEANGDYALGIFSSGWCQCLDSASRDLCKTEDNVTALNSGKWICHECCWNEASKESIKTKEPVEVECKGGIHLYAVPIIANGKAVGSMNFGHGSPPTDTKKLQEISALYQVDLEKLVNLANEYTSRSPQIIKAAKSQLAISAKLIGQIIEQKQVESELVRERDFSIKLIDTAQAIILVLNPDGTIQSFNPYMEEISGYKLEEVKGKDWFETFLPSQDWKRMRACFKEAIDDIQTRGNVNPIITKNDRELFIEWHDKTLKDSKGNILGLLTIGQDITERKQAEEKLHKTTYALGERVKELNCLYGISKLIEKDNTTTEKILQGTADLIPPSWQYPEITCAQIKLDGQRYKTDNFTETEWHQSQEIIVSGQKAGAVEVYYLEVKPIIYEGPFLKEERSLINAIAGSLGGIIERKLAEEALKKTNAQLLHSEKLSAIGSLSASIAHEFNNPLQGVMNIIKGVSKRVSLDEDDTELMKMADWEEQPDRIKLSVRGGRT